MEYVLRANALRKLAIDRDLPATGRAIALAVGLPPSTVNWMMNGRTPSNHSMAALTAYFDVPFDDLFERVAA